jgi:hypothetical protein
VALEFYKNLRISIITNIILDYGNSLLIKKMNNKKEVIPLRTRKGSIYQKSTNEVFKKLLFKN